jgi:hypothetical protein
MLLLVQITPAQGFGGPLTMQGVDHRSPASAASAASGGTVLTVHPGIASMFAHPASLGRLSGPEISVGSISRRSSSAQEQRYSPLKYYSNFSLFMEGLTRDIPDPAYDTLNHVPATAADSVQRPFDRIGPDWDRTASGSTPLQLFAAVPLTIAGVKIGIGAGMTQYADLQYYFRNNNVLAPSMLSPELYVRTRPINDADSTSRPAQWFQQTMQRDGSITAYGLSLSMAMTDQWMLGVSGQILDGTSDDVEQRVERGRLRFFQNYFRAESVYQRITSIGTSSYSGTEFTVSTEWQTRSVLFGVSVILPSAVERSFTMRTTTDTTGAVRTVTAAGSDKIGLPVRARVALGLQLRENLEVGLEYEYHPYEKSEYTGAKGGTSRPWISSGSIHIGARYRAAEWLVLRAGAMEQSEVFEQTGNPLPGVPVSGSAYSAGISLIAYGAVFDLGYRYQRSEYVDSWTSMVSINTFTGHSLAASCSYALPW